MFNIFIIFIFYVFSFLYSVDSEKEEPPRLDLRNFNGSIDNINIGGNLENILPDRSKENQIILLDHQIEAIKLKSKQFIPEPITDSDIIIISTNLGIMKFKFYDKKSPINSLNFKKLSNSHFYDKTLFHYVVPKFIIQGGDILSRNPNPDDDGHGGPGWVIDADHNDLKHKRGILSMIRTANDENSAGSQFFISLKENNALDGKHTVFSYLVEGDHILSRIAKVSSEYQQTKLLCKSNIPDNGNIEDWIELYDPVIKNNIYSKIPNDEDKKSYKETLQGRLNNTFRPGIPIIIDSIRVVDEKNINK